MDTVEPGGASGSESPDDATQADLAAELEERPTGDFIDGFLAGAASVNAALTQAAPNTFFYSFDWVDDGFGPREAALATAFRSRPEDLLLDVIPLDDWPSTVHGIAQRWLGFALPEDVGGALADEFIEILQAYLHGAPAALYEVRPLAADGSPLTELLGAEHAHILMETQEGRLLLEFSRDA